MLLPEQPAHEPQHRLSPAAEKCRKLFVTPSEQNSATIMSIYASPQALNKVALITCFEKSARNLEGEKLLFGGILLLWVYLSAGLGKKHFFRMDWDASNEAAAFPAERGNSLCLLFGRPMAKGAAQVHQHRSR